MPGKPDATMDEIVDAAKKANIHDFIMELPDKYGTPAPVSVRCCQHFSCRSFGTNCPKVPAFVEGGTMPKCYPINEEAAKRAKDMNSFSDYQPGSATAGYRAMVDEAYAAAERQKARVDPMYHDR